MAGADDSGPVSRAEKTSELAKILINESGSEKQVRLIQNKQYFLKLRVLKLL